MTHVRCKSLRSEFPIFREQPDLAYLDSAASSQKPDRVIQRIHNFYAREYDSVHRGIYQLSEQATTSYEAARKAVAGFLGGVAAEEVIFTRGTTESINLVAQSWGQTFLTAGDEIVLSVAEHHANLVPWQIIAERTGAVLRFIPLREDYRLDLEAAARIITKKTKLVAIAHTSNVLGLVHPVRELTAMAKAVGALVLLDGAQAAAHMTLSMRELDCDFYAFSGHKICGPTGIGVLWARREILDAMPPYQAGGSMISHVTLERSTWNELPYKFEAGTPHIEGALGLAAAIEFYRDLPRDEILRHEVELGRQIVDGLTGYKDVQIFFAGEENWVGIVTFVHKNVHAHDLAAAADKFKVCVRAGHHCTHPLMKKLGVTSSLRVSPFLYNTERDVAQFLESIEYAEKRYARDV